MLTLVLLPGLDGTGILFEPLVRELGDACASRIVSYPQDPELGYRELTGLVRDQLPEGDFFLLGESFSGPVALRLAGEKPRGLRGVILCATFIRNPSPVFPAFLAFLVRSPLFMAWPMSTKLNVLTSGGPSGEIRELMRRVRQRTNRAVLASRTREALRVDVEKELGGCAYPLLYLAGARDVVVPKRNLHVILSVRPDVRTETLATSHLVLQETPREAAALIEAFMNEAA